jgi:hypothetical protein
VAVATGGGSTTGIGLPSNHRCMAGLVHTSPRSPPIDGHEASRKKNGLDCK